MGLTDAHPRAFAQNLALQEVDLSGNTKLTASVLMEVVKNWNDLRIARLYYMGPTDVLLRAFTQNSALEEIGISDCDNVQTRTLMGLVSRWTHLRRITTPYGMCPTDEAYIALKTAFPALAITCW